MRGEKHDGHAFPTTQPLISLRLRGISVQVFRRTELERIDEQTDDNGVAPPAGMTNQGAVSLMKSSHGWDKTDGS